MTCVELQESLAEIEDAGAVEQRSHLKTCPACFALVTELNLIISAAVDLRETDEPSPRVWNSIESTLRREGVIHPPRPRLTPSEHPSVVSHMRVSSAGCSLTLESRA